MTKDKIKKTGLLFIVILLVSFYSIKAMRESADNKDGYANFFVFWLSGKMVANGQNPYDQAEWLAGYRENGFDNSADPIFLYPLPLSVFLLPFGLFSYANAFLIWKITTQILITIIIIILLQHWQISIRKWLILPLVLLAVMFYGPAILLLRTGSLSAGTALIICLFIVFLEKKVSFFSGILLSLIILKPSQGLTILVLVGVWLIATKNWKVIQGLFLGGVILWIIGASVDLTWVSKFLNSGAAAFDRRLGFQSNVWSFSYLVCKGAMDCTYLLGSRSALILLGVTARYLWKQKDKISIWGVMNISIPLGFVTTVYLWQYDQILYMIPIVWIVGTLIQKTKTYFPAFIFLLISTAYSLYALFKMFGPNGLVGDLWSIGNTLIIFAGIGLAHYIKEKPAKVIN